MVHTTERVPISRPLPGHDLTRQTVRLRTGTAVAVHTPVADQTWCLLSSSARERATVRPPTAEAIVTVPRPSTPISGFDRGRLPATAPNARREHVITAAPKRPSSPGRNVDASRGP
jgi:hypothetical protein